MIRKFIAAFVMIFCLSTTAFASEFIPVDGDKTRDYIKPGDIIRVDGFGMAQSNLKNFYKNHARQAARLDALRQLIEDIYGVQVEADKQNPNIVTSRISNDDKAFKLLEKNARVVDVKFFDDGACQVTMEFVFPAGWKK